MPGQSTNLQVVYRIKPFFCGKVCQVFQVVSKSDEYRCRKILDQCELLLGSGFDTSACTVKLAANPMKKRFSNLVPTIYHAVAINRVDHIVFGDSL